MASLLAIVVGVLYGAGVYLILRRSLVQLVFGLALISHGANLLLFTSAGLTRAVAPFVATGPNALSRQPADPLPQALILTAIVIGFGVIAFVLVLIHRTHEFLGTDGVDDLREDNE